MLPAVFSPAPQSISSSAVASVTSCKWKNAGEPKWPPNNPSTFQLRWNLWIMGCWLFQSVPCELAGQNCCFLVNVSKKTWSLWEMPWLRTPDWIGEKRELEFLVQRVDWSATNKPLSYLYLISLSTVTSSLSCSPPYLCKTSAFAEVVVVNPPHAGEQLSSLLVTL